LGYLLVFLIDMPGEIAFEGERSVARVHCAFVRPGMLLEVLVEVASCAKRAEAVLLWALEGMFRCCSRARALEDVVCLLCWGLCLEIRILCCPFLFLDSIFLNSTFLTSRLRDA
jgi:hypothetical protein